MEMKNLYYILGLLEVSKSTRTRIENAFITHPNDLKIHKTSEIKSIWFY